MSLARGDEHSRTSRWVDNMPFMAPITGPGWVRWSVSPIPVFNRNQGEILRRNAEYKQFEEQIKRVQRLIVSDIRQALNTYRASLKIFDAYRLRKREMDDLLNRSESAFSLGGITVLDMLDTRKTYRDFITKYNQALTQALLNQELIKVYTGELR